MPVILFEQRKNHNFKRKKTMPFRQREYKKVKKQQCWRGLCVCVCVCVCESHWIKGLLYGGKSPGGFHLGTT